MTATASAAPAKAGADATTAPATTRVTILTGRRMTDLTLPSAVPIEGFIDDAVAALAELLEDTPADVLVGFDFAAQGVWALARPGFPPMKSNQTLDEAGVVDGSLLTLVTVSRTERYRPLVEDVIDAIAVLDESPQFDRTALNRLVAAMIPAVSLVLTTVAALTWWHTGRSLLWPLVMGILGVLLLAGSMVATMVYKSITLSEFLFLSAVAVLAVSVAMAVPPPDGGSPMGPPQLAAGATTVMFLTLASRGGPRRRAATATFLVVTTAAGALVAFADGFGWQQWVPAGMLAFGLFVVLTAAKLTVAVARIALPPIPAPGETVDHEELLDPVATESSEKETATWQAIIASVPDSAVRLADRSSLAKRLLVGFVSAGALVLTIGAIAVVVQGHFFVHTLVVGALATATCGFRSRLYAERWCAWALLAAAIAVPTGIVVKLCLWYPDRAWMLLTGYLVAAVIAVAVVAATAGVRRLTPVSKRILELTDGAVIAAMVPMLLWVTGVYDTVRNLTF